MRSYLLGVIALGENCMDRRLPKDDTVELEQTLT